MRVDQLNLETVARNDNFNNWMYSEIKPYINGNILEVGSGLGTFSRKIIKDFPANAVFLSDVNEEYLRRLRQSFTISNNTQVVKLDLNNPGDFAALSPNQFDTIICLNVLEHIADDIFALQEIKKLLKSNGRLILLVPCHKWLYNELDKAVLHYRRYHKRELTQKIVQAGFLVERLWYFNFFSIFGWFVNGTIFKKAKLSRHAFTIFNAAVPILRLIEKYILARSVGMSLIAIAKKQE